MHISSDVKTLITIHQIGISYDGPKQIPTRAARMRLSVLPEHVLLLVLFFFAPTNSVMVFTSHSSSDFLETVVIEQEGQDSALQPSDVDDFNQATWPQPSDRAPTKRPSSNQSPESFANQAGDMDHFLFEEFAEQSFQQAARDSDSSDDDTGGDAKTPKSCPASCKTPDAVDGVKAKGGVKLEGGVCKMWVSKKYGNYVHTQG